MSSNGDGFGAWNPEQISRYTAENELETDGGLTADFAGTRSWAMRVIPGQGLPRCLLRSLVIRNPVEARNNVSREPTE
jgi:hypothetical protein